MNISNKMPWIFACAIGLLLGGCASPDIVLHPTFPPPAIQETAATQGTIQLTVDYTGNSPQLSQYEKMGGETQIGSSESMGVHLSTFWIKEAPSKLIERMLQNNLNAWGYQVTSQPQAIQLLGHIKKFALNSKAINAFEFQADGVVDLSLDVTKNGRSSYKGDYVETCTFKTATQIPNQDNMDKLFSDCLTKLQTQLDNDSRLRAALSSY